MYYYYYTYLYVNERTNQPMNEWMNDFVLFFIYAENGACDTVTLFLCNFIYLEICVIAYIWL